MLLDVVQVVTNLSSSTLAGLGLQICGYFRFGA